MDDVGQTLLNWASAFGTQEMVRILMVRCSTILEFSHFLAFCFPLGQIIWFRSYTGLIFNNIFL